MRKIIFSIFLSISIGLYAVEPFSKMATSTPILTQDGKAKMWCSICGMNLKMFYKTSYSAKLQNGKNRQYCSLRCLLVDMQHNKINPNSIKVVDAKSEKLIDAKNAYYVYGSKIKGTMAKKSKLAFETEDEAKEFAKKYGGEILRFDEVLKRAKEELKSDIAMIRLKKEKKIIPMGKKLFSKKCQTNSDLNISKYHQINELKADISSGICKGVKERQLQAIALYLWSQKSHNIDNNLSIKLTHNDKCPVCGMFVYKYPRWATQIIYQSKRLSFDGVKDMMKFYFNPDKWGKYSDFSKDKISKILVTDYYSQKVIDGKKAFYVIGSDVLGPMGNELIPFAKESDAKNFLNDHHGKKILKFDTITQKDIQSLDE